MAAPDYELAIANALEATPSCGMCREEDMRCEECVAGAKDGLTRTEVQWAWGNDDEWFGILKKEATCREVKDAGYDDEDAFKVWDYLLKEVPLMPYEDSTHRTFTKAWAKEQKRQNHNWIRHALSDAGCCDINTSHPLAGNIITQSIIGYAMGKVL